MRTSTSTPLGRLAQATQSTRPWLRVTVTSEWWARVLLAAGARSADTPVTAPAAAPQAVETGDTPRGPIDRAPKAGSPDGRVRRSAGRVGRNMAHARLRGNDLTGTDLVGANLTGADLAHAILRQADLRNAIMANADLTGAVLHGAILRDADLNGADLNHANLTDADLRGANLERSLRLDSAILADTLWSESTRWPAKLAAPVRRRSRPVGEGEWRIVGTETVRATVPSS